MLPGTYKLGIALRFPEFEMDSVTGGTVIVDEDGATYQEIVDGLVAGCSESARRNAANDGILIPESAITAIILLEIELIELG